MRLSLSLIGLLSLAVATPGLAATVHTDVALTGVDGPGPSVGSVDISDSPEGAIFTLHLHGLPPGSHGFHVHQNGSCAAAPGKDGAITPAGAAGGHFDPAMTKMHMGPEGEGHLGDLPVLIVAADGTASDTLTAPHLKDVTALQGHALMIHAGGDNYSDTPAPLGGGGARLACGVID